MSKKFASFLLLSCLGAALRADVVAVADISTRYFNDPGQNCADNQRTDAAVGPVAASASCLTSAIYDPPSLPAFGVGTTAYASAQADYGRLGVQSSVSYVHSGSGSVGQVIPASLATAGFSDWITIDGPGFAGTLGQISFQFDVEGTKTASSSSEFGNVIQTQNDVRLAGMLLTGDGLVVTPGISFQFGAPFLLSISLSANTAVIGGGPGVAESSALFLNTATLTGLDVRDAAGNPVADFSVSALSGTQYPLSSPTAVPEPAFLCILAPAIAGLLLHRRRQLATRQTPAHSVE